MMTTEHDTMARLAIEARLRTGERDDCQERLGRERIAGSVQYQELYRRFEESTQATAERDNEIMALRQVLVAVRMQLKADGREKWSNAIARIDEVLGKEAGGA